MRFPPRPTSFLLALAAFIGFVPILNSQAVPPEKFSALQWRLIGPFRGGRVVAVTGVPGDTAAAYFGSVDGGVWKSPNAGTTWDPIFDGQPIASIGAIAIAPSNPSVIYVGTGESDIRSALSSGNGVYKSSDGGKTWSNVGLRDTRHISRMVIDPHNPDVVYVAALGHAYGPNPERGVFKSTDGGKTWTKTLYKGPDIGASDLSIATANPSVLFAGMWQTHRPPWTTYAPLDGPNGGLCRSSDSGTTWTQLTDHGLPDGAWGRVGVSVAPDGNRVYALIEAGKKSGLYRSDDGGDTWTLANSDPRLTSRSWYFNWLAVDPSNPDVVYIPNVAFYRSEDAGKTITIVRGAPGGDDYHDIWVDPKNSGHLILGSDQGTTVSIDRGKTWSTWYNQPTAQMYHVATDNQFPYAVYGAQQDTGSIGIYSRTDHGQIRAQDQFPIGGGESGYIVVDPSDPNILYATGAYGGAVRYDRRTSLSQNITPWPYQSFGDDIDARKYRAPWTPVLVQSPAEKGVLYMGTQYVLRTSDGGLHWAQISPDLTGAAVPTGTPPQGPLTVENAKERGYGVVFSIAPSPVHAGVIWAGSDTGLLHLTRDGGKNWQNVTPPGVSDWSKITSIEASRVDPAVAYVAVDRHRIDDDAPHLFRSRDYGKTWQAITAGIGSHAFLNAIRQDPQKPNLLFAATELGIYISFDDGDHWQPLQLNLPTTSVRDATIHGDDLVIATHGRGFWILDDITPLRQLSLGDAKHPVLFAPETAIRVDNDIFLGTPLPPEEPTAKNPPDGAIVDYVLTSAAKQVSLDVYDANNKLVRRITSEQKPPSYPPLPIAERWLPSPSLLGTTPGMHRYVWDFRWGGSGEGDDGEEDDDWGAPRPPRVVPGNYSLKLTVDGESFTQPLKVTMDPRSAATLDVLAQQQNLGLEIYAEALLTRKALSEMDTISRKLSTLKPQVQTNHPELMSQITAVESAMKAIKSGTPGAPGSISGLAAASSALASALRVVENGDRTAPSQALEVYHLADEAAKASLADWQKLQLGALAELNRSLQSQGLPIVSGR